MFRNAVLRIHTGTVRVLDKHFTGESMNFRQVVAIFVPLLVDQFFIVVLSMLNTAMISSSGESAVAAVNMVDSLNIFLLNVFVALATGGTVIVAQYQGTQDRRSVARATSQAISTVTLTAILLMVLFLLFRNTVLQFLFGGAESSVLENAHLYFVGSVLSYPLIAVIESICGALRGAGASKASLWLSLIKNGTYLLFNILFLPVFHLGVWGLVMSLLLSRFIGMVCSLLYMIKINKAIDFNYKDLLHANLSMVRRILLIGIPFAAEQLFFNGGKLLTQTFIVTLGTGALAVNAICSSLVALIQAGSSACSLSIVTVVGQCMGRRNVRDARFFVRSFMRSCFWFYLVSELLFLPLMYPLIGIFSPKPGIIPDVVSILLTCCVAMPVFWAGSFLLPSAMRAAGDARFSTLTSLITMWLLRVVLGYVLAIILPFGIIGVWWAMIAEWAVRTVIFSLRFHSDRWHRHHLLD